MEYIIEKETEEIPCGQSVTTKYLDSSGLVQRQDILIIVDKAKLNISNGVGQVA